MTAAAFGPTLLNGFVDLDDRANIVDNPWIRGLGGAELGWMFTTFHLGHWQPLSWVSLALDHRVWGLDAAGYHLTSLALHTVNAMLVFALARALLGRAGLDDVHRTPAAFLAALLWALHPLRVESVAWATERRDVLSATAILTALLVYVRNPERRSSTGIALAAMVTGVLAKASGMVVPALLVILDVHPLGRLGGRVGWTTPAARRVWAQKLPFVAVAVIAAVIAARAQQAAGALRPLAAMTVSQRVAAAMYQSGFYLWKTVVPIDLLPMYEFPADMGPTHAGALAAAATAAAVAILGLALRRRCPGIAAAFAAYLVCIAPTLGLLQSGPQLAADRYTYLASIGWSVLVAGALVSGASAPWRRVALAGPVVVVLAILTARQAATWRDAGTLWTRAIAIDPDSAFAQKSMGDVARERGDVAGALGWYRKATSVRPYADAETTLAAVLAAQGQWDEADAHYRRALAADPGNAFAYTSYGVLLGDRGRRDEAIAMHQRAVAIEPGLAEAWTNLGSTLDDLGRADEARAAYEHALALRPSAETYNNLGALDLKANHPDAAAARFRQAIALRPELAAIHENLGLALRAAGDRGGAMAAFETALRLDPALATSRAALEQLRASP